MTPDLPPAAPDAPPQAALVAPDPAAEPIHVESHGYWYSVVGNRLLGPAEVKAAVESAQGPQQALDALRAAYQRAGYFLVALRGEVNNKLVAIQVIHGRIAEFDVTPPELTPFFTGLRDRDDLNRNAVIRATTMAEFYSSRQGMRPQVNFAAGAEQGTTRIVVTEEPIAGASVWNAGLGFGNLGSRYSSRYLASANGAIRPGGGLELTASYAQGLPGLSSDSAGGVYRAGVLGASLVTPWGLYGASFTATNYTIGESSAPLYPEGQIYVGSITGTQLLYTDPTLRWTVNEAYTHVDNDVYVFEGTFQVTKQHYEYVTLGTVVNNSFALFGFNGSMTAGASVARGITGPRGTFEPTGPGIPSPRFTQALANFNYAQSLPLDVTATLTWSGQWADATLPQNQQWVLGGFGNLSAWVPAVMVGDSGSLLRAVISSPPWQWQGASVGASGFYEWGLVRYHYTPQGESTIRGAADAGLSLSASYKTGTSLILAYAWPVSTRNVEISKLDRAGRANLYFSLNQSF